MNVLSNYDSDEEFGFNPSDGDWETTESLLKDTKQIRDDYILLGRIGQGSYSCVYKVQNIHTGAILCAKNFYPEEIDKESNLFSDISDHARNEIQRLHSLDHPSIISIRGLYRGRRRGSVYLLTDLYDTTLDFFVNNRSPLSFSDIKSILLELLNVLRYIHSRGVIHWHYILSFLILSDIKPKNILYKKGHIALCDWGSSTTPGTYGTMPTLGYRPPELLLWRSDLGGDLWTYGIDIWGWAVVVVEMLGCQYLFDNNSELTTINQAIKLVGTMNLSSDESKQFESCCDASHMRFRETPAILEEQMKSIIPEVCRSSSLLDLLKSCFTIMPYKRKSADYLLQSPLWLEDPVPCELKSLPDLSGWVEETQKQRHMKQMEMWAQLQEMLHQN